MGAKNLVGQKFGRLTVIRRYEYNLVQGHSSRAQWVCVCDCGKEHITTTSSLTRGCTASCGCLKQDIAHTQKANLKHGYCTDANRHPLYNIWKEIKQRCFNPNHKEYKYYGGRGITICEEWKDNPKAFIEWGLSHGYKKGLSIDRIDNDGNYEPSNCQFLTRSQNTKKEKGRILVVCGISHDCSDWSRILGHRHSYINRILHRKGYDYTINLIKERANL